MLSACCDYNLLCTLYSPGLLSILIPHLPGGAGNHWVVVSGHCLGELLLELCFPNIPYIRCLKRGYFHNSHRKNPLLLPLFAEALSNGQGLGSDSICGSPKSSMIKALERPSAASMCLVVRRTDCQGSVACLSCKWNRVRACVQCMHIFWDQEP